jgi:hypothetical protein
VGLANPTYRGLILGSGTAEVVRMIDYGDGLELEVWDEAGTWDGWTVTFAYDTDWYYDTTLEVDGEVTFPAAE